MDAYLPALPVLLTYAAAVVALTLTPGPDMTLYLSKTISHSRLAGFAAFAGASTGGLIHSMLVAIGLSALLVASATAFMVLKVVGALYLMWLAIDAIRNGSSFQLAPGEKGRRETIRSVYLKGILINLLNPKVIVFFLTFLPQFVSPSDPEAGTKLFILGLLFIAISVPINALFILSAGHIARFLKTSKRATRAVDYLFATVLGGFAVKLLVARGT
ncbi:LysE family translocator [Acuticoccus sp. M5D2P5]|uniref:LysE family translocator n=1 Tax=Acuticoccus kalidii TaxID=2910977 RepID=UPI001F24A3A5|nr:LysE family translocator [Acuticoccus kalidii]MCF3936407.1 LysE family translocator [Acuticoccus kalidii]